MPPDPRADALLVGIKEVKLRRDGFDGKDGCEGCEEDVKTMKGVLGEKYLKSELLTRNATRQAILKALNDQAAAQAGDIFVFYVSSHGGRQRRDRPDSTGEVVDQTLVVFDGDDNGDIIDNELGDIWDRFAPGVRIVMISDTCESGTNARVFRADSRALPRPGWNNFRASMVHFGGCDDFEESRGNANGGVFTLSLKKLWNNGAFNGNYETFLQAIRRDIAATRQIPTIFIEGQPRFSDQKPFDIGNAPAANLGEVKNVKQIVEINAEVEKILADRDAAGGPMGMTEARLKRLKELQDKLKKLRGG